MAGVRGRIGAALRKAGDVSVAAASKVTPGRGARADVSTKAGPAEAAATTPVKETTAIKASAAKKPPAKAGASKSVATKAPASKTVATKASAKKAAPAKKASAKKAPASKATAIRAATAKAVPAKAASAKAVPAKAVPAKAVIAKKASTAEKAPAKKASAKKAPAKALTADKAPPVVGEADNATELTAGGLTAADLAEIRVRLERELAEMRLEYDRSIAELNTLRQSHTDGAGDDQADAGAKAFEREQEQSIAANRRLLLTQIEHAIERIDSGTYGVCEDCGRPIPKVRLKALPMATLDAECKALAERR